MKAGGEENRRASRDNFLIQANGATEQNYVPVTGVVS